jgi:hypothetical protein
MHTVTLILIFKKYSYNLHDTKTTTVSQPHLYKETIFHLKTLYTWQLKKEHIGQNISVDGIIMESETWFYGNITTCNLRHMDSLKFILSFMKFWTSSSAYETVLQALNIKNYIRDYQMYIGLCLFV